VSTELSLSCDRSLVVKIPAAENALSASTDVGGTVNKYTSTLPRFPVLSNNAISALTAFISHYRPSLPGIKESSCNLQHGCRSTKEFHCQCQSRDSGLRKMSGIPGFGILNLNLMNNGLEKQSLLVAHILPEIIQFPFE